MNSTKEIRQIICKWNTSLEINGRLDQWQLDSDLAKVDRFVSANEASPCAKALRRVMYFATANEPDSMQLQKAVQSSIRKLSDKIYESRFGSAGTRSGQAETYYSVSKKLYNEKVRFKDNMYLRNIDTNFEDGDTTRKVRRIVEKRMSQAYYRTRKGFTCNEDRRDKIGEQRAISYQMRNLGQVELTEENTRTDSTHWKHSFDHVTGKAVLKPKKSFDTLEEAEQEAARRNLELDKKGQTGLRYSAYKCAYCGKYHIGHRDQKNKSMIYNPASAARNLYDGFTFAS